MRIKNYLNTPLVIILVILYLGIEALLYATTFNDIRKISGTGGVSHINGQWNSSGGNGGLMRYSEEPLGGSGLHILINTEKQYLTGSFWIDAIGWANMHNTELIYTGKTSNMNIWSLSGYAWSENAGWLDFSNATYNVSDNTFSGFIWNNGVGWISIGENITSLTNKGGIGRVKILGAISSKRFFSTTYTLDNISTVLDANSSMNAIRRNVAILTRNITPDKINICTTRNCSNILASVPPIGGMSIFDFEGMSRYIVYSTHIKPGFNEPINPILTTTVRGGDVVIDESVIPGNARPRVIISLKDQNGNGGNIYIKGNVSQINSSLVAEGSIYSGEYTATGITIYNNSPENIWRIPNTQLYIYGTVLSNNTIGGYYDNNRTSTVIGNICPYTINPCTEESAISHDFNYFRDFQKDLPEGVKGLLRGYPNSTYDSYSIVVEYNSKVLDSPPPGLENIY